MDLLPRVLILCLLSSTVWSQAPVVTVEPKVVTINQGEFVVLRCSVTSAASSSVKWTKLNSQQLPDNVKTFSDNLLLIILNVRPENQGEYRCEAGPPSGRVFDAATINVNSPPHATCLPDNVEVRSGDPLRLQCLAQGTLPITFQWSLSGQATLPPGAETTKDGRLQISNTRESDSGTYTCTASNHIGTSTASARVTVTK